MILSASKNSQSLSICLEKQGIFRPIEEQEYTWGLLGQDDELP